MLPNLQGSQMIHDQASLAKDKGFPNQPNGRQKHLQ